MATSDLNAAEQTDVQKLAAVVQEAFRPVMAASQLPLEEVMCNFETIEGPEVKQAAVEAVRQIAHATGLDAAQVTRIFKANRFTGINIVSVLHKESRAHA